MIVIGGGPVGSHTACGLAGLGYRVVVLEREAGFSGKICCTGIVSSQCAAAYGIGDDIIFQRVRGARLFSPSGKVVGVQRGEAQACIIDRPAFNEDMARRARDVGAEYMLNCRATAVEPGKDVIRVRMTGHGDGAELSARAVVVAAGFGSRLTEQAGLGRTGDFVMGVQAEVETVGADGVEVYFGNEVAPGFFAWLVPTASGKALAGLLSRHSPGQYLRELLLSLVARGKVVSSAVRTIHGGIPLKPPARTYGQRLLVVGDAAGQVKPTTGGGIYYGLLCADIAVSTLGRALEGDTLSSGSLSGYEREWRKRLGRELKIGYWARRFYERLSDKRIERIFDIIASSGIIEELLDEEDFSFDWHGEVVLRLLKYRAIARAMGVIKIPLRFGGKRD
ncbi:NAD(P)/FAD-dependent oxidoreductase [Chloroflexota bacterium]